MFVSVCDRPLMAARQRRHRTALYGDKNAPQITEKGPCSHASSPLPDLPIMQVMGDAHYLQKQALPEVSGAGGARLGGSAICKLALSVKVLRDKAKG